MKEEVKKPGIHILMVIPDSPAFHAGVRGGDRLISIDGVAVNSWQDYVDATEKRGELMTVSIIRGNQFLELGCGRGNPEEILKNL